MSNQYFDTMLDNLKNMTASMNCPASQVQKLTAETMQNSARKGMEAMNTAFNTTTRNMQNLFSVNSPEGLSTFINDCVKDSSDMAVSLSKEALNESARFAEQYASAVESDLKTAQESFRKVVGA